MQQLHNTNQQNAHVYIKVSISNLLMPSTCFEPEGWSSGRRLNIQVRYSISISSPVGRRVCSKSNTLIYLQDVFNIEHTLLPTGRVRYRTHSSIYRSCSISNKLFYLQDVFNIEQTLLPTGRVRYRTHSSTYRTCSISNKLFTLQDVFDIEQTLRPTGRVRYRTHPSTYKTANTDACNTHYMYQTCMYNILPEDGPSVSKHVEGIKKLKLQY
jgi:translation initiation factor IF-1